MLHITGLQRPPHCLFPRSGVIKVVVSRKGFRRLCAFVSASYLRDARRKMIDMGPGKLKNSRFYKAAGTYILPKTCNVWTAKALQSAGCPIPAFRAIRARDVFRQAEKFGTVIRNFPDSP